MNRLDHKLIVLMIAFASVFGVLSQAQADSVYIQNTINAYSNTGGRSYDGQDGQDGADGADGEDGRSGSDGETVISGNGDATVRLKTTIDGQTVVDITKQYDGDEDDAYRSTDTKTNAEMSAAERQRLLEILYQVRLILVSYVNDLF